MKKHTFVPLASVKRLPSKTVWIKTHDIMKNLGHIPRYFGIFGRPVESEHGLLVRIRWDVRLVGYLEYIFIDTSGSDPDSDDHPDTRLGDVRVYQGEANYYFHNMIDVLRYHGYVKDDDFSEPEVTTGYESLVNRVVWVDTSDPDEIPDFVQTYGRSISFELGTLVRAEWDSRMVYLLEAGLIYVNLRDD